MNKKKKTKEKEKEQEKKRAKKVYDLPGQKRDPPEEVSECFSLPSFLFRVM